MSAGTRFRRRPWALYVYAGFFLLILYGPVLLLPLFSVSDSPTIAFPVRALTLRWYRGLIDDPQLISSLGNSLSVAVAAAIMATVLGVTSAWTLTRHRIRGRGPIVAFMLSPLVVPGVVLGASLLMLTRKLGLEPSLPSVAAGHIVLCLPFSLVVMLSRFEGLDRSLEEASRDLGRGPIATFFLVALPNAWPGVLSSLLMTFTISFDEFVLALFLSGSRPTLPVYMWAQLRFPAKLPNVLALATLILASSFALAAAAARLQRVGRQDLRDAPL